MHDKQPCLLLLTLICVHVHFWVWCGIFAISSKFWGYTKSSGPNLGTFTYDIYISNGHQAFSGTSSLEEKTVCSFHSEYSSAETNSNTHFGYGFDSRQMGQGLFLNSHFSFASIVCFCFLRLTIFYMHFHMISLVSYLSIHRERRKSMVGLVNFFVFSWQKGFVNLWRIHIWLFEFGLLIKPRNWNGLQGDFLNLWMIYEMQNHTDDTKANSFIIQ